MATEENKVVEEVKEESSSNETQQEETVKEEVQEQKVEEPKKLDINELLKDKEFASQFDAKVTKSINTSKEKWEKEFEEKLNKEKQTLQESFENEKQTFQTKIAALSKDVKSEDLEDVITLSQRYKTEDGTNEEAIEKVLEKYPHFKRTFNSSVTKAGKEVQNSKQESKTAAQKYIEENYPNK